MMLAVAVVAAPVLGELIRKWRGDFYPTGDDAVEAIRAHDVLSLHPPLVGMYSGVSIRGGPYVYHLGPMVFWALAIPDRVLPERMGIVIAAVMVNVVAAVALLRSVRRTYGPTATLAAAALVAITCWSLGRNLLAEPWTPYIALIPLMLVLVYALELANGALVPLPATVLAGSFVVQAHYIYAPVVFASVATGVVLGITARRRSRTAPDARGRRAIVAAVLVVLVCWLAPAFDVLAHWPGNLTHWIEALRHPGGVVSTESTTWNFVARAIGWVPLSGRGPLPVAVLYRLPENVTTSTTVVAAIVVGVVVALTVALWAREPRAARFAASAAVLLGSLTFAIWRLPWTAPVMPSYRILVLWPVGAYVWTAAVVGLAVLLLRNDVGAALRRRICGRLGSVIVALVAIAASIVAGFGADSGRPNRHPDWAATRAVVGPTLAHLDRDHRYLIHGTGALAYFVKYGVLRAMLDHGYATFVPPDDVYLQHNHHPTANRPDRILLVTSTLSPLPPGARVIAEYAPHGGARHARLRRTRSAASAALTKEPLQLTTYGERRRRAETGTLRTALDAVARGTATPDMLLDAGLVGFVDFSRVDANPSRDLFVVGPNVGPALTAYADARSAITATDIRVALVPAPGSH